MDGKVIIRSGKGDYNMGKIINILPMANREDNLQEINGGAAGGKRCACGSAGSV